MDALAGAHRARRARLGLPLRTELLGIFSSGRGKARLFARKLARFEENRALSPLGRCRPRSGSGDRPLRVSLRNKFYGSNCVDCHFALRDRFGGVGMVDRKANTASPGAHSRDAGRADGFAAN